MDKKTYFLQRADENLPEIYQTRHALMKESEILEKGSILEIDLGEHFVGYLSFAVCPVEIYLDAPVRLRIRCTESKREMGCDYSSYKGWLSPTWLPEEILTLDDVSAYTVPRRFACRYIQIEVLFTPRPMKLKDLFFTSQTSADVHTVQPLETEDPLLKKMDEVSQRTLRDCMQRIFEDGPKRDHRLWTGDLRLQALTSYYLFGGENLVRRCLYLLAASERSKDGFLASFIYENNYFFSGETHLIDYALLFVVTVCDYDMYTKDRQTVIDLLETCKEQMDAVLPMLDRDGIVTPQDYWWSFIDWCPGLEVVTATQGVYLYALDRFSELLEVMNEPDAAHYRKRLEEGRIAAKAQLFNAKTGEFCNERDHFDRSIHAQIWMILGGVVTGEDARRLLRNMLHDPSARMPGTPYVHHYLVEAMVKSEMYEEALAYLKSYWGGMIEKGADTFWEAFVPGDDDFSPYDDWMVNSLCHAWSCTPAYFIRRYFQKC